MKNSLKIAFCANASWYLKNFRAGLMDGMVQDGAVVYAIAPRDTYSSELSQKYSFIDTKHLNRKGLNPFEDIALFFEYLSLYRKIKPDIVCNFTIKPNIYSSLACRILGIPRINTVTGLGYTFTRKTFFAGLVRWMYKVSFVHAKVVFQNTEDQTIFIDRKIVRPDQTMIIPGSGVDTTFFDKKLCPRSIERYSFILVARMLADKGVREFISAARIVHTKYPQATFLLVGPLDTNNPSALTQQELSSEEYISYIGAVDDVRDHLCQSMCAVLPSYREGLPKGLVEAMALELPIIASDVAGCRDVVDDNGILVPARDTQGLAQAMITMLEMPIEERTIMGARGRVLAHERFEQSIIITHYKELIRSAKR